MQPRCECVQAGEAPTEDVERDWQRMERERTQLMDMKQQVFVLPDYFFHASPSYLTISATCRSPKTLHTDPQYTGLEYMKVRSNQ